MINGAEGGPGIKEAGETKSPEEILSQILQNPSTTVDDVVNVLANCERNTDGGKILAVISEELAQLAEDRRIGIDEIGTREDLDQAISQIMFWSDPEKK